MYVCMYGGVMNVPCRMVFALQKMLIQQSLKDLACVMPLSVHWKQCISMLMVCLLGCHGLCR